MGDRLPVTGSLLSTVSTQQPHPPSAHIRFVPVSPGCEYSHSWRVRRGLAPLMTTGAPLSVNETFSTGTADIWTEFATSPTSHLNSASTVKFNSIVAFSHETKSYTSIIYGTSAVDHVHSQLAKIFMDFCQDPADR